jgi:hypothetical protein
VCKWEISHNAIFFRQPFTEQLVDTTNCRVPNEEKWLHDIQVQQTTKLFVELTGGHQIGML